jgi:hypothetical protein
MLFLLYVYTNLVVIIHVHAKNITMKRLVLLIIMVSLYIIDTQAQVSLDPSTNIVYHTFTMPISYGLSDSFTIDSLIYDTVKVNNRDVVKANTVPVKRPSPSVLSKFARPDTFMYRGQKMTFKYWDLVDQLYAGVEVKDTAFHISKMLRMVKSAIKRDEEVLHDTLHAYQHHVGRIPNSLQNDTIAGVRSQWKSKISNYTASYYNALYDRWLENRRFRPFPTRNIYFTRRYYGSNGSTVLESLRNNIFNFNESYASIYSELVAAYAGPIRLGFGALISTTKTIKISADSIKGLNTQQIDSVYRANDTANVRRNSLQNLLAGGGNVMLQATYPLYEFSDRKTRLYVSSMVFNQVSFDIPALGVAEKKLSIINNFGLHSVVYFKLDKADEKSDLAITLFFVPKLSVINSYKGFFSNIGLPNDNALAYLDLQLGVSVNSFKIYAHWQKTSSAFINNQLPSWTIGLKFTP